MLELNRYLAFAALVCGQIVTSAEALAFLPHDHPQFAPSQIWVVVRNERTKMSPKLEQIRKRLVSRRIVPTPDLRRLADTGDSLAAFAFAKRLSTGGNLRLVSDALHYYAIAAIGGRGYAVRPILTLVSMPGAAFKPAHLDQAERALNSQASRGNKAAIDGLINLYGSQGPFGAKPEEVERLLEARIAKGDGDAAYRLAIEKLEARQATDQVTSEIVRYLEIASESGTFGIRTSAVNIIALLRAEAPDIETEIK